jgi:hypothetical protein
MSTLTANSLEQDNGLENKLSAGSGGSQIGSEIFANMKQEIQEYSESTAEQTVETTVIEREVSAVSFNEQREIRFNAVEETISERTTPAPEQPVSAVRRETTSVINKAAAEAGKAFVGDSVKLVKESYKSVYTDLIKDLLFGKILGIDLWKKKELTPEEKAHQAKVAAARGTFIGAMKQNIANLFRSKQEASERDVRRLEVSIDGSFDRLLSGTGKIIRNLSLRGGDSIYDLHAMSYAQKVARREEIKRREAPPPVAGSIRKGPGVQMDRNKQAEGTNSVSKLHG